MKKNLITYCICAMLLAFYTSAYSAEGPYVSGNIGFAMLSDSDITDSTVPGITLDSEFDTGLALGVALGYGFGKTRIEGEIAYQKNDFDKIGVLGVSFDASGDATTLAFLLNGYYDFTNNSRFTPYVSAGLGFARIEVNDFSVPILGVPPESDDDTVFAYQIGAGVGYAVSKNVTIDVKYRYFATSDPKFDTTEAEFASHNLLFGVRVNF